MPLFSKKNNTAEKVDFKARLEKKLCLAREDPEPVYDLSDCNLKTVPSGTFVLCRVLRKEVLILKNNQLVELKDGGKLGDLSLLQTLDLSFNRIKTFKDYPNFLTSLKILNLSHNQLTSLPEETGTLIALEKLDVSHNLLKKVPESLGQLSALCFLDLRSNSLKELPRTLKAKATQVRILSDEGLCPGNISKDINEEITMKKFFPQVGAPVPSCKKDLIENSDESQAIALLLESRRQKQAELLKRLESLEKDAKSNVEVVLQHQHEQQNLARAIAQSAEQQLSALSNVRVQEEARSSQLASSILREEQEQQAALSEVLKREEARNLELAKAITREEEHQRKRLASVLALVPEKNAPLLELVLRDEQLQLSVLAAIRARQEAQTGHLTRCVIDDQQLREAALAVLREKGDRQSRMIAQEVAKVQNQLSVLTLLEMKRRNEENSSAVVDLSLQRMTLSAALTTLLEQQNKRRQELLEEVAHQMEGVGEALWLLQLQRLLDAPPPNLEVSGLRELAAALPSQPSSPELPSAPQRSDLSPEQEFTDVFHPSAPTLYSAGEDMECAICMDATCCVVFLPCGHVCSCQACSLLLAECPMCRQSITDKVPLVTCPSLP